MLVKMALFYLAMSDIQESIDNLFEINRMSLLKIIKKLFVWH